MALGEAPAVSRYRSFLGLLPALSTQGIGSKLVRGALELMRAQGLKVAAKCAFVAAFIAKHLVFNDLL
jgi:predicted GNAT family acetyltransferase